jgi:hypothetical protein
MTDAKWYCRKGEFRLGPYSENQLRQMIESGMILPTDQVRLEGWDTWVEALMLSDAAGKPVTPSPRPMERIAHEFANGDEATPVPVVVESTTSTSPGKSSEIFDAARRLGRIAWYYRWINRLALPYLILWLGTGFLNLPTGVILRIQLPWLLIWPPLFFLYARSMGRWEAPICAVVGLFPCLNLAALLGLNREARKICRRDGWDIGNLCRDARETKTPGKRGKVVLMSILLIALPAWSLRTVIDEFQARRPAKGVDDNLARPSGTPTRLEVRRCKGLVFYWSKDLQGEAERLASAFFDLGLFQDDNEIEVELLAPGERREIRMFLKPQSVTDAIAHSVMEYIGHYVVATAFEGQSVELQLIGENNSIVKSYSYPPGTRTVINPGFILCFPIEYRPEALRLAKSLAQPMPGQELKFATLQKTGKGWSIGLGFPAGVDPTIQELAGHRLKASDLSRSVFGGANVEIWVIGGQKVFRVDSKP